MRLPFLVLLLLMLAVAAALVMLVVELLVLVVLEVAVQGEWQVVAQMALSTLAAVVEPQVKAALRVAQAVQAS